MAARKIKNQPASLAYSPIAIYYDSEYGEYQVRIKGRPNDTYYTDDKNDAISTAQHMRNNAILEPVKSNPSSRAPKRKTAARTQRAAVGYVNRPSQITKKAPSKRLKKRRTKNLQVPRGVFPNPSPRYNEAKIAWELERTAMGDGFYGNALRVAKDLPGIAAKDRALLDRYATGNQRGTDHVALQDLAMKIDMKARKNPSSVHFDIDVNSHNARGAKAKTRTNPVARKKEIIVEYELSGQNFAKRNRGMYGWKELAKFPDTPEGSENAIQYAEAYHKIAPHLRIQVVTK